MEKLKSQRKNAGVVQRVWRVDGESAWSVHHDFGRANNLRPAPVAAREHFKNSVVRLGGVVPLGQRFVPARVKGMAICPRCFSKDCAPPSR